MRPKFVALLTVSALALVGCSAEAEALAPNEQEYLNTLTSILEPLPDATSNVSQEELLAAGYQTCSSGNAPTIVEAGIYKYALRNVIATSSAELCP